MGRERCASWSRFFGIAIAGFALAACSSDSNNSSSTDLLDNYVVSGSVGDGPIVGGEITLRDANGDVVGQGTSTDQATYSIEIPGSTALPVTVHVVGGTDVVTQRPADFEMTALITEVGEQTVNISPLTTLVTEAAECSGDTSEVKLDQLWQAVDRDLNIGLDSTVWANPMTDAVTAANAETSVIGNESLGEWVRRSANGLQTSNVSMADIVQTLACDLGDGAMDGQLVFAPRGVAADEASRVLAVAKAVEAGIRLEVIAGRLEVDGVDATAAMNDAVSLIMPEITAPDVNSVPVTAAALDKAMQALTILSGVVPDAELAALIAALDGANRTDAAAVIDSALDANAQITLQGLPTRIGLADATEIVAINDRTRQQEEQNSPIVAFGADPDSIANGATALLSWAASNADRCVSSWSDELASEGFWRTPALTTSTRYELTCFGLGGATSAYVDVTVDNQPLPQPEPEPEPQPEPQPDPEPNPQPDPEPNPQPDPDPLPNPQPGAVPNVALSVDKSVVDAGETIRLSWTSSGADSCEGSGAWKGTKNLSGGQNLNNITDSRTYSLSCVNAAGTAQSTVSVTAMGQIVLNWLAPTEYVDGSEIERLSAYRFHYGTSSGQYDEVVQVDGSLTSYTLRLPAGVYYFAMTSIDGANVESNFSAEAQLQAQ